MTVINMVAQCGHVAGVDGQFDRPESVTMTALVFADWASADKNKPLAKIRGAGSTVGNMVMLAAGLQLTERKAVTVIGTLADVLMIKGGGVSVDLYGP